MSIMQYITIAAGIDKLKLHFHRVFSTLAYMFTCTCYN